MTTSLGLMLLSALVSVRQGADDEPGFESLPVSPSTKKVGCAYRGKGVAVLRSVGLFFGVSLGSGVSTRVTPKVDGVGVVVDA